MRMKIEIYAQARMTSTRLPGKVMMPVRSKPLLYYFLERLKRVRGASAVVVLTTTQPTDDVIVESCRIQRVPYFRGPEEDVLARYYQAALERKPDAIVRVTSDCPLIDPAVVDRVIDTYRVHYPQFDYVANALQRTYPRGMEVEIFSFKALEQAYQEASTPGEREHVTPYLYRHPERFRLHNVASPLDLSRYRWTVDTIEDFYLIQQILEALYPTHPNFTLEDLDQLLQKHPEWSAINAHIQQKPLND